MITDPLRSEICAFEDVEGGCIVRNLIRVSHFSPLPPDYDLVRSVVRSLRRKLHPENGAWICV